MGDYEEQEYRRFTFKSEFDKSIHTLEGILRGIVLDSKINQNEINELVNWFQLNSMYVDRPPFNELIDLVTKCLEDNELTDDEVQDILWVCNNYISGSVYYDVITSDMQVLQGMLHGILADNKIDDFEIINLKKWLDDNESLSSTYPYDEIYSLVVSALNDGKLDDKEKDIIKAYFGEFIDTRYSENIHRTELDELKETMKISGICAVDPKIIIENNTFCFTGASSRTVRSEIKEIIESRCGLFSDGVTKKLNYLVIGDEGNPCWVFSCYGRKVEKALNYRKSGIPLLIVHENDFWKVVSN